MCSVAAPGIDAGGAEGDGVNLGCQNIADVLESIQLNLDPELPNGTWCRYMPIPGPVTQNCSIQGLSCANTTSDFGSLTSFQPEGLLR